MKLHTAGRYTVRTIWDGRTLSYDVMLHHNSLLVAAGFDMTSESEDAAVAKLLSRCMDGNFR
jgi:hypothetical protein